MRHMPDVIFISMENWHGVWRRNQNVAAGLARRFPNSKILYVCLPVDLSFALRKGHFDTIARGWHPSAPEQLTELPNIFTFSPIKLLPTTLTLSRKVHEVMMRKQIRRAAKAIGLGSDPLLYINPYWGAHFAGRTGESAVVYDIGDDWTGLSVPEWERKKIAAQDAQLTKRADAVIVTSKWLADKARTLIDEVEIIYNGVDVERFRGVADSSLAAHPMTQEWAHPVIGYAGTLHFDRSSADLILQVARSFPKGTIALVGPIHFSEPDMFRLRAEPNIRITGPVDHTEVPGMMRAFDVCFVPHHVGAFSESNSPLKLYEFLACGLPIVSTPVAGFRDYPELVYLEEEPAGFCAAIGRALAEDTSLPARRREEAAKHTWHHRIDSYLSVFEKVLAPSETGLHAGLREAHATS